MASASGRKNPPLSQRIFDDAGRFDFFQAVRVLESMAREEARIDPGRRRCPVGHDDPPGREIVRFRAMPALSFPAGAIGRLSPPPEPDEEPSSSSPPQMAVAAMGLIGPNGVLPQHYTALVISRIREKDYALRNFLDLFNHRTLSLFYRAWEKHHFPFAYERARLSATDDVFTQLLYCLVGLGTGSLRSRLAVDDEALVYYAGFFAHFPRCALSLEVLLGDYFGVPLEVRQFQGRWLYLAAEDQSSLPSARFPAGRNNRMGDTLLIGERVWNVEGKFRVRIGPLDYAQFRRFLPSGNALEPLAQMARAYVGPQLDFDVQLVLVAGEVPWCRLGGDGADPSRLGWNTWVRARPFDHDVDDAVFSPEV